MYLVILAAIFALASVLVGFRLRAVRASIWLAVAIVGQWAALQLVDAGPTIHYQHFQSLMALRSGRYNLPLLIMAGQALAVAWTLFNWRRRLAAILRAGSNRLWQWGILAALLVATSATVSRDANAYAVEIMFASILQMVSIATIVVFVLALPAELVESARVRMTRIFDGPIRASRRLDLFALGCAVWVAGCATILALAVYQNHPHVPDEFSNLYQARYFANRMLAMPAPPVPAAFNLDLFTYEKNRWYSPVPPGWPAMLAIGVWAGVPWIVNPLLAGINVILSSLFVERATDRKTARLACVLLCVSPWHVFMAMSLMNHTFAFTCLLIAALSVQKLRDTGNAWFGIPGGIGIGFVSLIRPLEGIAVAIALGLWSLGARGRAFRLSPTLTLTLATVIIGALQLPYNAFLTGDARTFPLMRYFDVLYGPGKNAIGFGPDRGLNWPHDPFPGHGLRDVAVNANLNTTVTNTELFGWASGSILPIGFLLVSRSMRRIDYQMAAFIGIFVAIQSLYWFSGGPDFGARYWYPALLPCIVLTIRGLESIARTLEHDSETVFAGTRVFLGVSALVLAALVTFFPWRSTNKYFQYRGMRPDIRSLIASVPLGRSVVFVRGRREPDYVSAAIYNPIDLQAAAPVFVWDHDVAVRKEVLAAYSDREVWFVDGPTLTGRGFEISGGPLNSEEALHFSKPVSVAAHD
jgi:hypothetical protein